jgi:hypothetical protein
MPCGSGEAGRLRAEAHTGHLRQSGPGRGRANRHPVTAWLALPAR